MFTHIARSTSTLVLAVGVALSAPAIGGCSAAVAPAASGVGAESEGAISATSQAQTSSSGRTLADTGVCWRQSYGRGVGTIPTECPEQDKNGALCYDKCAAGFDGAGPVCWEQCPAGYHDDGAFCRKDVNIISSNHGSCPWYDVCGLTFARGCSTCPPGYKNDGCTCRLDADIFAKKSYGRGAGNLMSCGGGKQYDAGLCYDNCSDRFDGAGPVCWQQCPAAAPVACGAGCAVSQEACASSIGLQVLTALATVGAIASEDPQQAAEAAAKMAEQFDLPICDM
jgi:hypothetical protein